MTVYRYNKEGYLETLNTVGDYKPKGWYTTIKSAKRYKNKK